MKSNFGFLVVRISPAFLMIIDTNTRVKYLSGNLSSSDDRMPNLFTTGMSPLYKPDGSLDTVSESELNYLLDKSTKVKDFDDWFDTYNDTYGEGAIGLHIYEEE